MREVELKELAWRCPDEWVPWSTSEEIKAAETIVGQARAVDAIAFGLGMQGTGYNIFVTGLSGTGRLTTIKSFLEGRSGKQARPDDVCFVFNFQAPEEPGALLLKAGAGRCLRDRMDSLIEELKESLPAFLKDKAFRKKLEKAIGSLQKEQQELIGDFEKAVEKAGFGLVQIQVGPVTQPEVLPVLGEEAVPLEDLEARVEAGELKAEEREKILKKHERLKERMQEVFNGVAEIRRKIALKADDVAREMVRPLISEAIAQVAREVEDERAKPYLDAVAADIEENLDVFRAEADGDGDPFLRWRVNLAVDNGRGKGLPVIIETEPSYTNLFGTIERNLLPSGEASTNFMKIRAGSLLAANGGFLVLNAEDMLSESRVWTGLKRALKYGRVTIQTLESLLVGAAALKPEAVPLNVKVVVIGDRGIYDALFRWDKDFKKIFKVLADFDMVMPASKKCAEAMVSVLAKVIEEEGLRHIDRSGLARLIEESVRMSYGRGKFSTRFSDLADLMREASWRAGQAEDELVTGNHVRQARAAARHRHSLSEDRTRELVRDGVIRIATEGTAVGRLNGLAVYDLGHYSFGKPSRISAQVGLGREGVINIERQAGLSGPTHDKGVQILTGFLRGTFARRVPLSMACSLTFEQSYGGIDGDSASSTEIYAILSALSEISLRQDVAVTGSVDQYGAVQSIGGVNQKIEGFFRVCSERGLSGTQGVMIPFTDVNDLHLDDEVLEAVEAGNFHIWAVESIAEGIEHLTGVRAGTLGPDGRWEEDSVFGRCQLRLEEMTKLLRKAGKAASKDPEKEEKEGSGEGDEGPKES